MEVKRVRDSAMIMAHQMEPHHANPAGNVHGGVTMKLIDTIAGVVAIRHARRLAVTASIDRLDFHHPVYVGDVLILKASLNMVGKTSMEVGVRVEAENIITGEVQHAASAYLTFVALDDKHKPIQVPGLILEKIEEQRRNQEAQARRQLRLAEKSYERSSTHSTAEDRPGSSTC